MPSETHILLVKRVRDLNGATLYFTVRSLRRGRSPLNFLRGDEVPEFEGEEAWFECQRQGGKMRPIRPAAAPRSPPR